MFDSEFVAADDREVVAAIEECTRAEAAVAARRLAAIAELARRRVDLDGDEERAKWVFDGWASAATEVAAAMTVGQRRASGQMRIAVALRDRLPRVAALFLKGEVSSRIVAAITWRTQLVEDAEAIALIDAACAAGAMGWGPLSEDRLEQAIDVWVHRYDPDAVRQSESAKRSRDFHFGDRDDAAETTSVWGRLLKTDAAVAKRRVAALVANVCDGDPRTAGERRSDAVGVILVGGDRLACRCGSDTCPAVDAPTNSSVVIHVIAEQAALDAASPNGSAETITPAVIVGEGIAPTPVLKELIRGGAKVRPITMPSKQPEPNYRPSAELAAFVRMRDLFCRAPGCDVPADRCDLDHTIPYPMGPTHASNLKCLCRTNHLAKTFDGWHDVQFPDGTVVWTSPSGRTYTTKPGSRLFFPNWDTTSADLPPPTNLETSSAFRSMMMPTRRRTRAAEDAARIKAERARYEIRAPF